MNTNQRYEYEAKVRGVGNKTVGEVATPATKAFDSQHQALLSLSSAIDELEQRLKPISTPVPTKEPTDEDNQPTPVSSEVVSRIDTYTKMITYAYSRVQELLNNLEV